MPTILRAPLRGAEGLRLGAGALVLVAAAMLAFRLGDAPVSTPAELRCHEIVQSMLATGDWLVPHRGGEPWLNKPPLFYWLAAGAGRVVGDPGLLGLRLPSMLAAVGLVVTTLLWGRSVGGMQLGLTMATLLVLTKELHSQGRDGTAEMLLALLANVALLVFDRIHYGGRRSLAPVFAFVMGLTFLAKATAALLVVGVPLLACLALEGRLREGVRARALLWASAAALPALAWYGLVLWMVPGASQVLHRELVLPLGVGAGKGSAAHFGPPYEQVVNLCKVAFPAILLLPIALWRGWQTRLWAHSPRLRFAAVIAVSLLAAFCALPQKRADYLLPLLPAGVLLLADSMLALVRQPGGVPLAARTWLAAVAFVAGLAGGLWSAFWLGQAMDLGRGVVAVCVLSGVMIAGAAAWTALRGQLRAFGLCAALGWVGLLSIYFGSYDLWRREFKTGRVVERADYDAEHWSALRDRHPRLLSRFETKPSWSLRQREEADGS